MLAETERFVWLAGDTLYTGSRSKWKLWLNKIASSVDQQAKPWMLSHTRSCTCRMLEVTHTSPTSPSPQMDRSQSMNADYKTATGPFHFCLDKAAVLNGSPHSAFTLDQTASIWRNKAYSYGFFSHPALTKSSVSSSASNEETIETTEKTIRPPAIKRQKKKEYNMLGWQIFCGSGTKMILTLESLASQRDLRFADHIVPWCRLDWWTEIFISKRGRSVNTAGDRQWKPRHIIRPN